MTKQLLFTLTVFFTFIFCYSGIAQIPGFDGNDDFISRPAFLGNKNEVTMMSWIKLNSDFNGGEIMGQRNFRLFIDADKKLKTFIKVNASNTKGSIITPEHLSPILETEKWYHVATTYNGKLDTVTLFLNGEMLWIYSDLSGNKINGSTSWNSEHDFEVGRNTEYNNNYFEGSIYEIKVFNKTLTQKQLKSQIHQEIKNNDGNLIGTIVPKNIVGLHWDDLELYYKMDSMDSGSTPDSSSTNVAGILNNMTEAQEQTAPIPYQTKPNGDGDLFNPNNWLHGDVWDLSFTNTDCAIVKIDQALISKKSFSPLSLVISNNGTLTVKNHKEINISQYLKLDGKIILEDKSQLVQGLESELDPSSSGTLTLSQQGTRDLYTYNYWSSPVGSSNNETNNSEYTVSQILKDGTDLTALLDINFIVDGYDGTPSTPSSAMGIADYWIWKYGNLAPNYYNWKHLRSSGTLKTGEGFTMKGVANTNGNSTLQQNYVFKGKPNNGTIHLNIDTNKDYLIGNPYASAIDANQFILDNVHTKGTLYFKEHYAGGSHRISGYQGGNATYNLSGGVPAMQNLIIDDTAKKIPSRFIPIAQGFYVTGSSSGMINFNNGQRVFKIKDENTQFLVNENTLNSANQNDLRLKIRLSITTSNNYKRQILVTQDNNASPQIDFGYDGENTDDYENDLFWMINNKEFVIQGTDNINSDTVLPLGLKTSENGLNTFKIDALKNAYEAIELYIYDKKTQAYHDINNTSGFSINLNAGNYLNRFELRFNNGNALSTNVFETKTDNIEFYYANKRKAIVINNPKLNKIKSVKLLNLLGQSVTVFNTANLKTNYLLETGNIMTGNYIIEINTNTGKLSKKVLVE